MICWTIDTVGANADQKNDRKLQSALWAVNALSQSSLVVDGRRVYEPNFGFHFLIFSLAEIAKSHEKFKECFISWSGRV